MKANDEYKSLIDELIKLRYEMSNGQMNIKFADISMSEYLTLHEISDSDVNGLYEGKTYLKDLADKMDISIKKTSNTVRKLTDMGLVVWEHDGDGTEGTYVSMTSEGRKLLEEREKKIEEFFVRVIDRFGKDDMKKMLQMLKKFVTVLSAELENEEAEDES